MTPMERYENQRRNRHRLYGLFAGFIVAVVVLSLFSGVMA